MSSLLTSLKNPLQIMLSLKEEESHFINNKPEETLAHTRLRRAQLGKKQSSSKFIELNRSPNRENSDKDQDKKNGPQLSH